MIYVKLSSDSSTFTIKKENDKKYVTLSWFSSLDLTNVKFVGLSSIQIDPMATNENSCITIYCNLIKRTEVNPLREIACLRILKNRKSLPNDLSLGMTNTVNNVLIHQPNISSAHYELSLIHI